MAVVAACGGGVQDEPSGASPSREPSIAEKLATIEAGHPVEPGEKLVLSFRRQLDALSKKCKGPRIRLADYTVKSQELLGEKGVEESLLSIITNVQRSIPEEFGRTKCSDIFAAYVILRTGG